MPAGACARACELMRKASRRTVSKRWPGGLRGRIGRRRRTLPPGRPGSTIRAARLNDRVRDGNGCGPRAIAAGRITGALARTGVVQPDRGRDGALCSAVGEVGRSCLRTGQAARAISTARLRRSRALHLPPINVLISNGPSEGLRPGSARLEGGFPLRCFQRFSRPNVATRRCRGCDSRYTRGQSVPVLSY